MQVDEAGDEIESGEIEALGIVRRFGVACGDDFCDAVVANQHGAILKKPLAGFIEHVCAEENEVRAPSGQTQTTGDPKGQEGRMKDCVHSVVPHH